MPLASLKTLSAKEIAGMIAVAILFLIASFLSNAFAPELREFINARGAGWGILTYLAVIMTIVLIPFASTLPMIPIAVALWGNIAAAAITLVGWLASGALAFIIARRYGKPVLVRIISSARMAMLEAMVPQKNLFWGTVALGMVGAPIDLMSYAFGTLTAMPLSRFFAAFVLGLVPFSLFITYTATFPLSYQTYLLGALVLVWMWTYAHFKSNGDAPKSSNAPGARPLHATRAP